MDGQIRFAMLHSGDVASVISTPNQQPSILRMECMPFGAMASCYDCAKQKEEGITR